MIQAKLVYDAYPDSDLLAIEPPLPDEGCASYVQRIGRDFGDSLFYFILAELSEDHLDGIDGAERLSRALDDLDSVRAALMRNTVKPDDSF